jgi:hypothetical protein
VNKWFRYLSSLKSLYKTCRVSTRHVESGKDLPSIEKTCRVSKILAESSKHLPSLEKTCRVSNRLVESKRDLPSLEWTCPVKKIVVDPIFFSQLKILRMLMKIIRHLILLAEFNLGKKVFFHPNLIWLHVWTAVLQWCLIKCFPIKTAGASVIIGATELLRVL